MDRNLLLLCVAHHQRVLEVLQYIIERRMLAQRRLWVRKWIFRRDQFGMYDQLLLELRNEDPASFVNFMRMPPAMFELLARVGPRITKKLI